ncbi:HD domain-containing protein [Flavobacterium sp. W21_SRS_FM6]|uniref:HD domain-containing protein n=1 Tax=Flavobacterium sp. W21_SRS_FM6 TaxID=3240268 RepID=UPI003F8D9286
MSELLLKAKELAKLAHSGQTRKFDDSPYIDHLLEVVKILQYFGINDEVVLIAGLLHDTLEDTSVTAETIVEKFGQHVLDLVKGLTDDKSLPLRERKANALNKMEALSSDAHCIKLADLISNLSALPKSWTPEKCYEYFKWCEKLISSCNKASNQLIELATYLLAFQSAKHSMLDMLKVWAADSNIYWAQESHHLLFVAYTELGDVEARIIQPKSSQLHTLFELGLLRNFVLNEDHKGTVLVVGSFLPAPENEFKSYFVDCTLVDLK